MSAEIVFLWVGKTSAAYARTGIDEYIERAGRYRPCRILVVAEEKQGNRYSSRHRLEREGRAILERLEPLQPAVVVALDPSGKALSSARFAAQLERACYAEARRIVFVVGGPDGLSSAVRERADRLLSLSRMTLPHDMARLVLAEQVYRALTIIHGHPYDR